MIADQVSVDLTGPATIAMRAALAWVLISAVAPAAGAQRVGPRLELLDHAVWSTRAGAPTGVRGLAQSADGALWIGATTGLYQFDGLRFEPFESPAAQPLPSPSISALLGLPDGTLWIGYTSGGASVLADGRLTTYGRSEGFPDGPVTAFARDSTGAIWAATTSGLARFRDERWQRTGPESPYPGGMTSDRLVERPREAWGLAIGSQANALLEDRDGTVWVGTNDGLHRFRETKLTPVIFPRSVVRPALAAGEGGSVWVGSYSDRLFRVGDSVVSQPRGPAEISCAHRDLRGGVWLGGPAGLWYAPADWSALGPRFTRVALPAEAGPGDVRAIARSLGGDLWVSVRGNWTEGVFRRRGGLWSRVPAPEGTSDRTALTIVTDSAGRTWLGYAPNRLVLATGDSTRTYSDGDGLRLGAVSAIFVRDSRVWVGGESGIMVLDGGRFRPVKATERLRGITGIVETGNGDLWLNGAGGVTHIAADELRRAVQDSAYRARAHRLDHRDGLDGQPAQVPSCPTAMQGSDGRLWFATDSGVAWLDPTRIKRNMLPPPVRIRAVSADGRRYDHGSRVSLPPRTAELQIDYTAISLATPHRVRFRYRLAGADTSWQEAGTRRQAYYANLAPGSYRFQVIAANEDDVWNEAGATIELDIPPAFTQTKGFLALIASTTVGVALLLALWRQRPIGLAPGARARTSVERSLGEVRRSATAMRAAASQMPQLHAQLAEAAHRTFATTGIDAHVEHMGSPRPYPAALEADIVRIATEAMTNARQHADCQTVAVACTYAGRELRVRVRDDGRGFDPARATPSEHWGLVGMRERAAAIGAQLSVTSVPRKGTEVLLVVPGGPARWTWWQGMRPVPASSTHA